MKKIPTLFKRIYENHKVIDIVNEVTPGLEWVLDGEGFATVKYDGACCCVINGNLWRRYDAKKGKTPPEGAIPCCDPDPITGHWPHWILCNSGNASDKWFIEAHINTLKELGYPPVDCTYEAVGPHFQGNPYGLEYDTLIPHGANIILELDGPRTFDSIRDYLKSHEIEGIVFWKDGEPQCKIKRSDFGFKWPVKKRCDS